MYRIVETKKLTPESVFLKVTAPRIARRRRAGQFVVLRIDETGERFPLTIVDSDPKIGTITLVAQEVGTSTKKLGRLKEGEAILDVTGPLGHPTDAEKWGTVACLAGGIGVAEVLPVVKEIQATGNFTRAIIGARTQDLVILEEELRQAADELYITTDDGSYGRHGLVTEVLRDLINDGSIPDRVYAIGPLPMMRAVADLTRPYGIPTIVSLNALMVDGTGMCGSCRVTVGGETKFTCVDGPDFDGHQVDFEELGKRQKIYIPQEKYSLERFENQEK
ncbi:MAG: sulfide/dihydroorotate dehydrogenase-like FAD/NAD-binding protein [Candidatus Auribacterota bacterium]|nr:sulfide/dihydroorotate dehydrogenase-like FAD/NAD-binding protein [Candidatus Auribacterota bacterium]